MKTNLILSQSQTAMAEDFLNSFSDQIRPFELQHSLDLFIPDEELIVRLKMCKRSLYTYRDEGLLSVIPLKGRNLTFLPYLIQDLLALNIKRDKKNKKGK